MKTLIVNADDLGYTKGINAAVAQCFEEGVVRSATIMANGDAFEDAVAMVKYSGLSIGVHLVLTEMMPLAPASSISGLVDDAGLLPSSPSALMALVMTGKASREMLRKELSRQIERVLDAGLIPTHLDSHKHVHVLPQVLEVLVELAARYSIQWIRNPFESATFAKMYPGVAEEDRRVFMRQHVESFLTRPFRGHFLRRVHRAGLRSPDRFYGVSLTGIGNLATMVRLLRGLPDGVCEWMAHPGVCDRELRTKQTRLLEQREKERSLLCSNALKELIARNGISLSAYGG